MESESSLTLHRPQYNWHVPRSRNIAKEISKIIHVTLGVHNFTVIRLLCVSLAPFWRVSTECKHTKKYSRSFVKLQLNPWCHMHYFTDLLAMFLDLGTFQLYCCLCRVRQLSDSIKNIFICAPKTNEGLMGLKQHEGEQLIIFGWSNPLNVFLEQMTEGDFLVLGF